MALARRARCTLQQAIGLLANIKSVQAIAPPSAVKMAPVIMLAAGLARKTTAFATSRGSALGAMYVFDDGRRPGQRRRVWICPRPLGDIGSL